MFSEIAPIGFRQASPTSTSRVQQIENPPPENRRRVGSEAEQAPDGRGGPKATQEAPAAIQEARKPVPEELDLNRYGRQYRVHDKSGKLLFKVYDKETGETIREVPPEESLRLSENIQKLRDLVFSRKVDVSA